MVKGSKSSAHFLLKQRQRILKLGKTLLFSGALFFLSTSSAWSAGEPSALWAALRSGEHFVLIRHALAPGMGDPAEFTLGECHTQRNLSAEGRAQAVRIGTLFRDNGIKSAKVFSSQWCRCLETADLLALGPVQELTPLNSFFSNFEDREPQTDQLREWLSGQSLKQPLVLVTHQVNIAALTDIFPSSGELVVVRRAATGELLVVGTLETD